MEHSLDLRMRREERGDFRRRRRAPRVRFARAVERRVDRRGALVVEDAAAHRDQIHDLVPELRIVGRDVAADVAIVAAERLGAARDDDVDAVARAARP